MSPVAGWYPDPAGSGRQRYFDGTMWTANHQETVTRVYTTTTPTGLNPKHAGWYQDPQGNGRRRYWDGQQWTDHIAEREIVTPGIPHTTKVVSVLVLIFFAVATIAALIQGEFEYVAMVVAVVLLGSPFVWGVWRAFQYDKRRKQRQQAADRDRALAINADMENAAYIQGDDRRGVYGQFPPPPELQDGPRI